VRRAFEAECGREFGSPWLAVAESPVALRTKAAKMRTVEARINAATTEADDEAGVRVAR